MTPELDRWLTERLAREREATLRLVFGVVERLLNETLQHNGKLGLDQEFAKLQSYADQLKSLIEKLQLDRAALNEPIDGSVKMN